MTAAHVNSDNFTSGAVGSPIVLGPLSWTSTPGNRIYVGVRLSGNASAAQPTVSTVDGALAALGTWQADGGAGTSHGEVFVRTVTLGIAHSVTISWTGGNAGYTVVVWEVSGTTGEVVAQASGSSTLPSSGPVSPSVAGILYHFTESITNAQTFTSPLDNSGGNAMTMDEPPSGSLRASLSHRSEAAGTYTPRITQTSEAWVSFAVFATEPASGISSDAIGRMGARGINDATVTHTTTATGRIGARGVNTVQSAATASLGRVGTRGVNDANVTHNADALGRTGARGVNAETVTHTTTAVGRVGMRGVNTVAPSSASAVGRVGTRGINDAYKVVQDFSVGGCGARGMNEVAAKATATQGRIGVRGVNAATATHVTDAVGRHGLRGISTATKAVSTSATGRLGHRGVSVSSKTVSTTAAGRVGARGVNVWVSGVPPTPEPVAVANSSECVADWTLTDSVVWSSPEEASLSGCESPAGAVRPWEI